MRHIKTAVILSAALALGLSAPASSAVYKCKDELGNISYSQLVCPEEAQVDKIIKLHGSSGNSEFDVQCGLVKSFAAEIGIAVNKKRSLNDIVMEYGGVSQISPIALKMIRSVYEYQSQPYKTAHNSVEFEKQRCLSEVYGVPDCSHFPIAFISSYGGCASAADTNLRLKRMAENSSDSKLQRDSKSTSQQVASSTKNARKRHNDARKKSCEESVNSAIHRNQKEARSAQSIAMQDQLRSKKRELRERLARCSG